jgi:hypothetical protein
MKIAARVKCSSAMQLGFGFLRQAVWGLIGCDRVEDPLKLQGRCPSRLGAAASKSRTTNPKPKFVEALHNHDHLIRLCFCRVDLSGAKTPAFFV